jgi:hypothetical protein
MQKESERLRTNDEVVGYKYKPKATYTNEVHTVQKYTASIILPISESDGTHATKMNYTAHPHCIHGSAQNVCG